MSTNDPQSTAKCSDLQLPLEFDESQAPTQPARSKDRRLRAKSQDHGRPRRSKDPEPPAKFVERHAWADRPSFLGPPPLTLGEDPNAYYELRARFSTSLQPFDTIEEVWAWEATDLVWEKLRYRRYKANLINAAAATELSEVLLPLGDNHVVTNLLAANWVKGKPRAIKIVTELLAKAGLTMDAVVANAIHSWMERTEILEAKIIKLGALYNDLLREIDQHRAGFGQCLRRSVQQVEDAEYHVIDDGVQSRDQP